MDDTCQVIVHRDASVLAAASAARLITRLADVQAHRGSASVVLTGGGIGISMLREIRESPARAAIDWSNLEIWWGDERFVPSSDSDRNELRAREALLDFVPVNPTKVHPMPAADVASTPEQAAQRYATELASHAHNGQMVPYFDVLLLGLGPEGHIASIFPDSPAAHAEGSVVAVRDCPKPPPIRVSLTFSALRSAAEVWMIAAGSEKAPIIDQALHGANPLRLPAAGAYGTQATLWLLDKAAAQQWQS